MENGEAQNFAGISRSAVRLSESTRSAVIGSEAYSVFVSGDDIYSAGMEIIVIGDKWV
jgi:hypothetical protein